eukprot:5280607-Pleurochrysis_carterae.AAC.4
MGVLTGSPMDARVSRAVVTDRSRLSLRTRLAVQCQQTAARKITRLIDHKTGSKENTESDKLRDFRYHYVAHTAHGRFLCCYAASSSVVPSVRRCVDDRRGGI